MKIMFIDTETTGLYPNKHGIISISWQIREYLQGKFGYYPTNDSEANILYMYPGDVEYDLQALRVNGFALTEIRKMSDQKSAYDKFLAELDFQVDKYDKTDKMFFCGYNADFDMKFIDAWFRRNNNNFIRSYFWYPLLDVAVIAGNRLSEQRSELKDFKLATVAEFLGIHYDSTKLHGAMEDMLLTKKIYDIVKGGLI